MKKVDEILNIAHLTNVIDGRSNSGTARVAREIILELSKDKSVFQTFIHFEASNDLIYQLPNTREIIIPLSRMRLAGHFYAFLRFWIKNLITQEVKGFDVVHWHASRVYPFFYLVPSRKIVITLHDATSRIIDDVNTIWTRIFYWNLRLSKNKYDYIIGDSVDACRKLVQVAKFPLNKVKCVYLASNFDKLEARRPEIFDLNEGYILCVSRWQPYKNVVNLILAYGKAVEQNRDLPNLVLVGKPVSGFNNPQGVISDLNLEKKVLVFQDLKDEELAFLYDHALLSVNPSLHEGFGLPVLEGLKRGCPSVDHVDTATSEISGFAGIHVDMRSPDLLSQALIDALSNRGWLQEFRKKAKERGAHFDWKSTVESLMKLYSE
jgi:glycosyltransferase involved in cell wall biosynthesis